MKLPNRQSESGQFADLKRWMNQAIEYMQSITLVQSATTRVTRTRTGTFVETRKSKTDTSEARLPWRGDWSAEASYTAGDVVFVRVGDASGTYLCTTSHAAGAAGSAPSLGNYWAIFPWGNTIGEW